MKKTMAMVLAVAGLILAEDYELAYTKLWETVGTPGSTAVTQYIGTARTTINSTATPPASAAVWKIQKWTYDAAGNLLEQKTARPSNGALFGNVWTNRAAATYR